jgi:hypothetical protein
MNYLDALLTEALITAPGCPETLVERALRVSAHEFYRDSESWRVTTDPMPVIKGRTTVDLDVGLDLAVVRIFWARLDGKPLRAMSPRNLTDRTGTPQGYAPNDASNAIQLDAVPLESYLRNGLVVNVALAPDNALTDIPDELFNAHRNGILYGAQRMLLLMPNVPWGDARGAQTFALLFEAEKTKARRTADARQAGVVRKVRYGGI